MDDQMLLLQDRRVARAQRLQLVLNGVPAAVLLTSAVQRLGDLSSISRLLAWLDLLASAGLMVAMLRELRGSKGGSSDPSKAVGIGWVQCFAGLMLAAEGIHLAFEGRHHLSLVVAYLVAGLITVGLGIFNSAVVRRQARRRSLVFDNRGITARLGRFRGFKVTWGNISSIQFDQDTVRILDLSRRARPSICAAITMAMRSGQCFGSTRPITRSRRRPRKDRWCDALWPLT